MNRMAFLLLFCPLIGWGQSPLELARSFLNLPPTASNTWLQVTNATVSKQVSDQIESLAPNDENLFARPGVWTDQKNKTVYLLGEMSDMNPGETIEFFLISKKSGHNYEALTIAYAVPSDFHAALESIGLKPGYPVHPDKLRFWPRGDRLTLEVAHAEADKLHWQPLLHLARDLDANGIPTNSHFVFVGSEMVDAPGEATNLVYAADVYSPVAMAANYNESRTVLDLPRQISKGAAYGKHQYDPTKKLPKFKPVLIRARPVEGDPIEQDVTLTLLSDEDSAVFGYQHGDTKLAGDAKTVLGKIRGLIEAGYEPHVTVTFDDALTLSDAWRMGLALERLERPDGIRIGPPQEGHPYFRAFLPNEQFRERTGRPLQPYELHLERPIPVLQKIKESYVEGQIEPDFTVTDIKMKSEADWKTFVEGQPDAILPPLFIYADGKTTYAQLMEWIGPALKRFGILYVFKEDAIEE